MNEYKNYMDNVSVDMTLHKKIMKRLTKSSLPAQRKSALNRYAASIVCAALMLIALLNVPKMIPSNTKNPQYKKQYTLFFNNAKYQNEQGQFDKNKKYIPGYFTQELSKDDISTLFKSTGIIEGRRLKGSFGFTGEGVLDGVTVICEKDNLITSIQLAIGPVWVDYNYPEEPEISNVNGVLVTAGYWNSPYTNGEAIYYASFEIGQTGYYLEVNGDEKAKEELTYLVNLIVEGGAVDLSQIKPDFIPKWREDKFTLAQAKADPDFGGFIPKQIPSNFRFESSRRTMNQDMDELSISYINGMKYLEMRISRFKEEDRGRVVNINQPETYDLSLYPIPRADSVPDQLREIVDNPIFKIEELTLKAVKSRAYTVDDSGDDSGYRMHFSVLYGDIVVQVNAKGVKIEDIFSLLNDLNNSR